MFKSISVVIISVNASTKLWWSLHRWNPLRLEVFNLSTAVIDSQIKFRVHIVVLGNKHAPSALISWSFANFVIEVERSKSLACSLIVFHDLIGVTIDEVGLYCVVSIHPWTLLSSLNFLHLNLFDLDLRLDLRR